MIFRLTQKLGTKINVNALDTLPLDENPFADWSASSFVTDRGQYILLSNTASLYSIVMRGKGITNDSNFIDCALSNLRKFIEADGEGFVYRRLIEPATASTRFATTLNRSITGSMNDMIKHATHWLADDNLAPFDVSFRLNEIPMSALARSGLPYGIPREAFKVLAGSAKA